MTAKHTLGPWSAHHITGNGLGGSYDHYEVRVSGKVLFTSYDRTDSDRAANAQLIAAAPELLEALEAFISYNDSDPDSDLDLMLTYSKAVSLAREALAKARGDN